MKIVLIAPNVGRRMGGEAIKAYQYFDWLLDNGHDARLITHGRNADEIKGAFPAERVTLLPELAAETWFWRIPPLRGLLDPLFHLRVRRELRNADPASTILHYICPISPVMPRFSPGRFRRVLGPLSGNIHHPPGFRERAGRYSRLDELAHPFVQRLLRAVLPEKRRVDVLLVSGGARTRHSLRLGGARDSTMIDVLDSGVSDSLLKAGADNTGPRDDEFAFLGRLVGSKGVDLAIRALARVPGNSKLTIYGLGPEFDGLQALAAELGMAARVRFAGWLPHDDLAATLPRFRAFVFPTLCEANGIAVQEAMALRVPVIALRWGGPSDLLDETTGLLVEPGNQEQVVADLAAAMQKVLTDEDFAKSLAKAAHDKARRRFDWSRVAESWYGAYGRALSQARPDRPG